MRYLSFALPLLIAVVGCNSKQQRGEAMPTESAYRIVGATVPAPSGPAWRVIAAEDSLVLFEQANKEGTVLIRVQTLSMPVRLSDSDVFSAMGSNRVRQIDSIRFDVLSLHLNNMPRQGVPCLQYDYVLRDRINDVSIPQAHDHTAFYGHTCYVSPEAGRAVEMEWSFRSGTRETPRQIFADGKQLVEAVQLETTDL